MFCSRQGDPELGSGSSLVGVDLTIFNIEVVEDGWKEAIFVFIDEQDSREFVDVRKA